MRCGSENRPTCWSSEVSGSSRNHSLQEVNLKSTSQQTVSVKKKKRAPSGFFFFFNLSQLFFSAGKTISVS